MKEIKKVANVAIGMSALTMVGSAMGSSGTPVTNFTKGFSSTMATTGTMMGSMLMLNQLKKMKGGK